MKRRRRPLASPEGRLEALDMDTEGVVAQLLDAWRVHNGINLFLLDEIPAPGLKAVPAGSKGRTVAEQFAHMNRVRLGWLAYHATGKRPRLPRAEKGSPPSRARLKAALRESGDGVEAALAGSLAGDRKIKMLSGQAVRFMGYLISHESHHRGQILLALKQQGIRLGEKVAIQGVWGKWMWGK